jgi:hypothetical protein
MKIHEWLDQGIENGFINDGEAYSFYKSHASRSTPETTVTKRTRTVKAKTLPPGPALKADGTPAKRRGRKPKALTETNGQAAAQA